MPARGAVASHATVRHWARTFGQLFARSGAGLPVLKAVDPDEVYLLIRGTKHGAAWAHLVQMRIACPDPRAPWARLGRFRSATTQAPRSIIPPQSRQVVPF